MYTHGHSMIIYLFHYIEDEICPKLGAECCPNSVIPRGGVHNTRGTILKFGAQMFF